MNLSSHPSNPSFLRHLIVRSAGCSSGEVPYTMAMVLAEFAGQNPVFTFSILATDICTTVLEKAKQAIYEEERIEPVPLTLKRKYLLRGKEESRGQAGSVTMRKTARVGHQLFRVNGG